MRTSLKAMAIVAALVLSVTPAMAIANKPAETGGPQYETPPPNPGPGAGKGAKAKAYGRYCKGESRKHVKGEPGTPYSRCVKGGEELLV